MSSARRSCRKLRRKFRPGNVHGGQIQNVRWPDPRRYPPPAAGWIVCPACSSPSVSRNEQMQPACMQLSRSMLPAGVQRQAPAPPPPRRLTWPRRSADSISGRSFSSIVGVGRDVFRQWPASSLRLYFARQGAGLHLGDPLDELQHPLHHRRVAGRASGWVVCSGRPACSSASSRNSRRPAPPQSAAPPAQSNRKHHKRHHRRGETALR